MAGTTSVQQPQQESEQQQQLTRQLMENARVRQALDALGWVYNSAKERLPEGASKQLATVEHQIDDLRTRVHAPELLTTLDSKLGRVAEVGAGTLGALRDSASRVAEFGGGYAMYTMYTILEHSERVVDTALPPDPAEAAAAEAEAEERAQPRTLRADYGRSQPLEEVPAAVEARVVPRVRQLGTTVTTRLRRRALAQLQTLHACTQQLGPAQLYSSAGEFIGTQLPRAKSALNDFDLHPHLAASAQLVVRPVRSVMSTADMQLAAMRQLFAECLRDPSHAGTRLNSALQRALQDKYATGEQLTRAAASQLSGLYQYPLRLLLLPYFLATGNVGSRLLKPCVVRRKQHAPSPSRAQAGSTDSEEDAGLEEAVAAARQQDAQAAVISHVGGPMRVEVGLPADGQTLPDLTLDAPANALHRLPTENGHAPAASGKGGKGKRRRPRE